MRKDRVKNIECVCSFCRGLFLTSKYNISQGKARFCSFSCAAKYKHSLYSQEGEENPNFRNGGMSAYERKQRFAENHPEKVKAYIIMNKAIKAGLLKKQPCGVCGAFVVEAHHTDYSQPLNVVWLCKQHHRMAHGASC